MSDIEIYTALECCKRKKCDECPYKKYSIYGCKEVMIKDTHHNFGRLMREVKEKETILVLLHRHFDKTKKIIPKGVRENG